jgi:hypothetical protein
MSHSRSGTLRGLARTRMKLAWLRPRKPHKRERRLCREVGQLAPANCMLKIWHAETGKGQVRDVVGWGAQEWLSAVDGAPAELIPAGRYLASVGLPFSKDATGMGSSKTSLATTSFYPFLSTYEFQSTPRTLLASLGGRMS